MKKVLESLHEFYDQFRDGVVISQGVCVIVGQGSTQPKSKSKLGVDASEEAVGISGKVASAEENPGQINVSGRGGIKSKLLGN